MKKTILLLVVLSIFTTLQAQQKSPDYQDADTSNVIRPKLFEYDCNVYNLMMGDQRRQAQGYPADETPTLPYYEEITSTSIGYDPSFTYVLQDLAQPYDLDTNVAINGIVMYGYIDHRCFQSDTTEYFKILDSNHNVLAKARMDTMTNTNLWSMWDPIHNFVEIKFDSTIVVSGRIYADVTFNSAFVYDTIDYPNMCSSIQDPYSFGCLGGYIDGVPINSFINYIFACDSSKETPYPYPEIRFYGDSIWHTTPSLDQVIDVNLLNYPSLLTKWKKLAVVALYPEIDTAFDWQTWNAQNSSGLVELESKMDVTLYPNPAKNELNIVGNSNIESVEIVNSLGVLLKRTETNTKTCKIDIADFPTGVYFVTIHTPNGTSTKKFVKE